MSDRTCSLDDCEKPRAKRGWCHMHYLRWYRTGEAGEVEPRVHRDHPGGGSHPIPVADRFWGKVEKTETCWLWRGALDHDGYGYITTTGRTRIGAHRQAYMLSVGPIPDGLTIDHLCRVVACVNPDHLEPVTNRENLLRSWTARRAR